MNFAAAMSSETAEHFTPPSLLERVRQVGLIDLDPCWSPKSFVDPVGRFTEADDGLTAPWKTLGGLVFVNPPYGRGIGAWTDRCAHFGDRDTNVLALVPSRTDTAWFQRAADHATAVCFLRGRLRFWTDRYCLICDGYGACTRKGHVVEVREKAGEGDVAPFPSALLLWGSTLADRFYEVFVTEGLVFT